MEIQNIPGFKLSSTTITCSPPNSRFSRGRGGGSGAKRWRAPAEVKALDFGAGLEAYMPPRVLAKRPNSSRQRQRSKEFSSQDKEIQFDIEDFQSEEVSTDENKKVNQSKDPCLNTTEKPAPPGDRILALAHEKEKDFHQTANATYQQWSDCTVYSDQTITEHGLIGRGENSSELYRTSTPRGRVSTASSNNEGQQKEHEPPRSPQQWFQKTLQQYEDLKKSVDAQMSSSPSSINERGDIAPHAKDGISIVGESRVRPHRSDPPSSREDPRGDSGASIRSIDQLLKLRSEVTTPRLGRKQQVFKPTNMLREGRPLWERPEHVTGKYLIHGTSPILRDNLPSEEIGKASNKKVETKTSDKLTRYSCGCPPQQVLPAKRFPAYSCGCPPKKETSKKPSGQQAPLLACQCRPTATLTTNINEATGDNMAWKQLVDTVTQLRTVNKVLQSTIEELTKPEQNFVSSDNKEAPSPILADWCSLTKESLSSIGLYEPEVRKQVLGTLRSSVKKMQGLMQSLKEEQEKSEILGGKLNGFLAAKSEHDLLLLGPSPEGSRATSPSHDVPLLLPSSPKKNESPPTISIKEDSNNSPPCEARDPPPHEISNKEMKGSQSSQSRESSSPSKGTLEANSQPCPKLPSPGISSKEKTSCEPPQSRESSLPPSRGKASPPSRRRESYRFVISNVDRHRLESMQWSESSPIDISNKERNSPLSQESSLLVIPNRERISSHSSQRKESYRFLVSSVERNSLRASKTRSPPLLTSTRDKKSSPSAQSRTPSPLVSSSNKMENISQPSNESSTRPEISEIEKNSSPASTRVPKPSQTGVFYSI